MFLITHELNKGHHMMNTKYSTHKQVIMEKRMLNIPEIMFHQL